MTNRILHLHPGMTEREILADTAQFIWEHLSEESKLAFHNLAEEEDVSRGEEYLLQELVNERLKYDHIEDWLKTLPGRIT